MTAVEFECRVLWLNAMLHYQRVTDHFSDAWFWRRKAEIWLINQLLE